MKKPNLYKYSLDGKTIEAPLQLFEVWEKIEQLGQPIIDTFTPHDLRGGVTKQIPIYKYKKPTILVYIGQNLKQEDLIGKYDSFGSLIE